jgi:hypothetical protein
MKPTEAAPVRLVVLSPDELRELVHETVTAALAEREPASTPTLLDRRGLGRALGCCCDTVDKLRREGMPEVRVGDVPRFHLDDVIAWLKTRKRG